MLKSINDIIGHMIADEMNYQSIGDLNEHYLKVIFQSYLELSDYQSRYAGKQFEISLPNNALLIAICDDELMILTEIH